VQQNKKRKVNLKQNAYSFLLLHAHLQKRSINYWRNKSGAEIDFVIRGNNENVVHAIECKFSILSDATAPKSIAKNFETFRSTYAHGDNYVVAYNIDAPFTRKYGDVSITFVNAKMLVQLLQNTEHIFMP